MHSLKSLKADTIRLGIESGDTIFVHSSFKSIGPVNGGAAAVVGALEDALGPDGLLLMPSFNRISGEEVFVFWDQLNRQKLEKIGDANCRLFLIREFLDILMEAAKAPQLFENSYRDAKAQRHKVIEKCKILNMLVFTALACLFL